MLSWIVVNHRLLIVLLSERPVRHAFAYIDSVLYPTLEILLWKLLTLPAIGAAIALFFVPIPTKYVFRKWLQNRKQLREIRSEVEGLALLTVEEGKELRSKFAETVDEYETEIGRLRVENDRLKKGAEETNDKNETVEAEEGAYSAVKMYVLTKMASYSNEVVSLGHLKQELGDSLELRVAIDEMQSADLLNQSGAGDEVMLHMRPKGRRQLLDWRNAIDSNTSISAAVVGASTSVESRGRQIDYDPKEHTIWINRVSKELFATSAQKNDHYLELLRGRVGQNPNIMVRFYQLVEGPDGVYRVDDESYVEYGEHVLGSVYMPIPVRES